MWESIKNDLKRLAEKQKRQIEVYKQIEELEREAAEKSKSMSLPVLDMFYLFWQNDWVHPCLSSL